MCLYIAKNLLNLTILYTNVNIKNLAKLGFLYIS